MKAHAHPSASAGLALAAAMILAAAATAQILPAPAHAAEGAATGWRTYGNARFGYSICYPADVMRPQPEATNGDGRAFTARDGAELRVWGQYNVQDDTVASASARERADAGGKVSYSVVRPGWYVFSATVDGEIVYHKSILAGDRFVSFEMRYPASRAAAWKSVVERLNTCLVASAR